MCVVTEGRGESVRGWLWRALVDRQAPPRWRVPHTKAPPSTMQGRDGSSQLAASSMMHPITSAILEHCTLHPPNTWTAMFVSCRIINISKVAVRETHCLRCRRLYKTPFQSMSCSYAVRPTLSPATVPLIKQQLWRHPKRVLAERRKPNKYIPPTLEQPDYQAGTSVALAAATTPGVEGCEGVAMASNVLTR